ncbi:uncharacterized protein LOC144683202 [Cetorhinus maximus]
MQVCNQTPQPHWKTQQMTLCMQETAVFDNKGKPMMTKGGMRGSPNSWNQMDVTKQLSRAVEETSPDLTIVTEEQNEVIETNKDTEDTMSCNDISTSSMDSCFEANTGSKVMNKNSHESSQQSHKKELDNMQEVLEDEDKVLRVHCHHTEEAEDASPDLTSMTEEHNIVIKTNKDTEDATNCKNIARSSSGSCSNVNSGLEAMSKSLQDPLQRATTLEVDDVQRMQEDEVNTGPEAMSKSLQEPPQRATTLELDDMQRMQEGEDKKLQKQNINKGANTNQSSLDKTTELDQNKNNDEKQTLEAELQKCIEDLKKLKIPSTFINKQRHWQNELLKKYDV